MMESPKGTERSEATTEKIANPDIQKSVQYAQSVATEIRSKTPPMTKPDIPTLREMIEHPEKAPSKFQTRTETKRKISLWLDKDVIAAMKAEGPGWQTRINEMLRGKYGA